MEVNHTVADQRDHSFSQNTSLRIRGNTKARLKSADPNALVNNNQNHVDLREHECSLVHSEAAFSLLTWKLRNFFQLKSPASDLLLHCWCLRHRLYSGSRRCLRMTYLKPWINQVWAAAPSSRRVCSLGGEIGEVFWVALQSTDFVCLFINLCGWWFWTAWPELKMQWQECVVFWDLH